MGIPPKSAVSRVVGTLKRVISRQLKEQCPHGLSKVYWDGGGGWARGCFASTVGINEATIRHYVQHQGEQETGHAQLELSGDPARKGGGRYAIWYGLRIIGLYAQPTSSGFLKVNLAMALRPLCQDHD